MFLESPEESSNERIAVSFYPYDKWDVEVRFHYCHERTDFARLWTEIEHHFDRSGLLKNARFDGDFQKLDLQNTDWDSVVIGEGKRSLIERNVIGFLNNLDSFKGTSLRSSRGVLLVGPPGTGKTLTCRVVISQLDCTVIYMTRDHITKIGAIDSIYRLARRLAPSLIIFEDIDTLGGADRLEFDSPSLGEFLNCLSGVVANDGVVTLATTNYPQKLDWALTDRPGRFDMRLDIDYPDIDNRKEILRRYISGLPIKVENPKEIVRRLAQRTEGFTGAYLQELIQSSYMAGLESNDYSPDGWKLKWTDFDQSLTVVERMRSATGRVIEPRVVEGETVTNPSALYG
jgi:SpoVK/Ycf46/Vps4 family AAA+-type ATPase